MTNDEEKLGHTNRYPMGALGSNDEGELNIAIGTVEDRIVIKFGAQVSWIGMTPDHALEIARLLTKRANAMKGN